MYLWHQRLRMRKESPWLADYPARAAVSRQCLIQNFPFKLDLAPAPWREPIKGPCSV